MFMLIYHNSSIFEYQNKVLFKIRGARYYYNAQFLIEKMDAQSNTKTIRQKLLSYETQTRELISQFTTNSNKQKAILAGSKMESLKNMATSFIKFLTLSNQSAQEDVNDTDAVFDRIADLYQIKGIDFKVLVGFAILGGLNNDQVCKDLSTKIGKKKMTMVFQDDDSDEDYEIQFDESQKTESSSVYTNKISLQTPKRQSSKVLDSTIQVQFESDSEIEVSIINFQSSQDITDFNSDYFQHEDQEVSEYLYKLSKATTELSYLCQRMKWPQPTFEESKSKINNALFSCAVKVSAKFKANFYPLESQCLGAVSKKEAKRISSLFMLRKLYNRFPQVWKKFKKCRQDNPGIQQTMNAQNQELFKNKKFDLAQGQIFKQQQKNQQINTQESKQIHEYLQRIKSHKSQLNVFQGRYNKKVTQVQFEREKQDQLSLWPVRATINDGKDLIEAVAKQTSKKAAQQKCCRQLLHKLYIKDFQRWHQFKKFKLQKGLQ